MLGAKRQFQRAMLCVIVQGYTKRLSFRPQGEIFPTVAKISQSLGSFTPDDLAGERSFEMTN
jgi:hypothetical protein